MSNLVVFFSALVLSVSLIPLMIRLAPRLGMVDYPDVRKVHAAPIPRAGGVGIVIGTLVPVLFWAPMNPALGAYVGGSLILLGFGMWDDARNLGARIKFIGQFAAAILVVYLGNIQITSLPFMDLHHLPAYIAKPFTVFAIVGMINALNVSDGLDGLAGGLSILSLGAVAYLSVQTNGYVPAAVALATLGGVLGFMRYNTHPARVFMGDAGSQFLGFTLGFITVFLVQQVNQALSPSLPLLILGLPIADLLSVIAQRLYFGISPFVATKHHVHHRLLALAFDHYEAVVIIYAIQTTFVLLALQMKYDSDGAILAVYSGICGVLFLYLFVATRLGWRIHATRQDSRLKRAISAVRNHAYFRAIPARVITIFVPLFLVLVSIAATKVPKDFVIGATILAVLLVLHLIFSREQNSIALRAIIYVTAAFAIYFENKYVAETNSLLDITAIGYFVVLAVAIGLAVRYASSLEFRTTPMDYLVILIVLAFGLLSGNSPAQEDLGKMGVKLVILFYGCEFIIARTPNRWGLLNLSVLAALAILIARGLGFT